RILELAEQLIRLSGLEPYRDISIAFSGLRPGEKLAEELVACAEDTVATSDDKIRVIERNGADGPAVERDLEHLLETLATGSRDGRTGAHVELRRPTHRARHTRRGPGRRDQHHAAQLQRLGERERARGRAARAGGRRARPPDHRSRRRPGRHHAAPAGHPPRSL